MNKELVLYNFHNPSALDEVNEIFKIGDLVKIEWAIPEWNNRSNLKLSSCIYLGAKYMQGIEIRLYGSCGFVSSYLTPDIRMIKLN